MFAHYESLEDLRFPNQSLCKLKNYISSTFFIHNSSQIWIVHIDIKKSSAEVLGEHGMCL